MDILNEIINKVNGLECIVIADRDGVPLIKAAAQKMPETIMRSGFLSTFAMAAFQGRKLGMGENRITISIYSSYQIVQMDLQGMIVTFIGNKDCNLGQIICISKDLSPIITELLKIFDQL